jgi:hypothetical protein
VGWGRGADWIDLAPEKGKRRALVNAVMNLTFMGPCIIVQFIKKFQQGATMYQHFIVPYLYLAYHVSGDTSPIIRSLKLRWQPLVFHTCKVAGHVVGGRCQAHCA